MGKDEGMKGGLSKSIRQERDNESSGKIDRLAEIEARIKELEPKAPLSFKA